MEKENYKYFTSTRSDQVREAKAYKPGEKCSYCFGTAKDPMADVVSSLPCPRCDGQGFIPANPEGLQCQL